jgi:hypothetical protein
VSGVSFAILGPLGIVFFGVLAAPLFVPNPLAAYLRMALPVLIGVYCAVLMPIRWLTERRLGRVSSIEGAVRRGARQRDTGAWVYTFTVAGQTFSVSRAAYDALDDRYLHRLYLTVQGHVLVNIEPVGEVESAPPGEGDAHG